MQTLCYIIIILIVFVLVTMFLVRQHRRNMHLRTMAEFYRETHWRKEPEQGIYCKVSVKEDPLADMDYMNGSKIEREINEIIKRFKKDPNLLKDTEKEYFDSQQRDAVKQENQKKKLIAKRVFAYDYEELLFQLYKPTAKKELGGWSIEGLSKNEIIQGISNLKCISSDEAETIFNNLVDHDLIYLFAYNYELSPMLLSGNYGWNIVSNTDMNFEKWMIEQIHSQK